MDLGRKWVEFRDGMRPRIAEWRFMLKRIRQSSLAMVGLIIVISFAMMGVLAPVLAPPQGSGDWFTIPRDTQLANLQPNPIPPVTIHIFGTTDQQYDLYYACIWGSITAFRVGVFVVAISLLLGILVGTIAAYYGGLLDEALMRFTDIIIAFPGLVLAMALVLGFPSFIPFNLSGVLFLLSLFLVFAFALMRTGRHLMLVALILLCVALGSVFYFPLLVEVYLTNLDKVLLAITIVGWPGYARVIRGEIMRIKNEDYVEASKASGSSDWRVIIKHILPNSIYPLVIVATLDIGSVVLSAAALSFLGIGASPDYADWGQVISRSRRWITDAHLMVSNFHTFFIPGLFITLFVVGWNLLGDALRDVLDPMLRRR